MSNKYLVISPNNYGNVGDDICAYAGKKAIEKIDPTAQIKVTQPPMNMKLMKWADYIILSGGGVLYDRARDNVDNFMRYIDTAHDMGKKSAVLGVGVQGIVSKWGAERYVKSLSKCEFVSVRTERDKELLEEIGFNDAHATFDIAYFTPEMIDDIPVSIRERVNNRSRSKLAENKTRPRIGIVMINLRMLKRESYEEEFKPFDDQLESFIDRARETHDIFLMQHAGEDESVMKPLAQKYNVNYVPYKTISDLPDLWKLYNSLDVMMGVRLHSIALGIMTNTPVIGVGSENAKQFRLANYGLPTLKEQFCNFTQADKLSTQLNSILENETMPLKTLTQKEKDFIQSANDLNLDLLRKMITS